MKENSKKIIVKMSPSELASEYNVDRRTFRVWIKRHLAAIGDLDGRFYTPKQVRIIFERIGPPPSFDEE